MIGLVFTARVSKVLSFIASALLLTGCVHVPPSVTPAQVKSLQAALLHLSPEVQEQDAAAVAALAYDYPRELAQQYRLVRPPLWHNLLINLRLKKRGLCYQWAEDLMTKLQSVEIRSLELHWGVARPGSFREHNTVVITAPQQPFTSGIVLDPWRQSGTLFWGAVTNDIYPWTEGLLPPPTNAAQPTARSTSR